MSTERGRAGTNSAGRQLVRALVVAGEAHWRKGLRVELEASGAVESVMVAPNARVGLAKFERGAPELVVIDARIEGGPGDAADLALAMTRGRPATAVILLAPGKPTTPGGVGDAARAAAGFGADGELLQLPRPPAPDRGLEPLRAAIGGILARPRPREPLRPPSPGPRVARPSTCVGHRPSTAPVELLAIGASTGGPRAVETLIGALPPELPVPVLITQHMPPVFTRNFAAQLDRKSGLAVREAEHGDLVTAGTVLVAPGGLHLGLRHLRGRIEVVLSDAPPENSCRPSVDFMFRAVVEQFGGAALGVILTGMGADGLRGCERLHAAGGEIFAQDESSSVVWGMPGIVVKARLAAQVLPLEALAPAIVARVGVGRGRSDALASTRGAKTA